MKLVDDGYGKLIAKEQMKADRLFPSNQCANVYLKPAPEYIDKNFFKMCGDIEITDITYTANFNKDIESNIKKIVQKYHPHKDVIFMSQITNRTNGMNK